MPAFLIGYIVIGVLLGIPLVLTQAFHKDPWTRKQVENTYGPAYAMGFMVGLLVIVMTTRP